MLQVECLACKTKSAVSPDFAGKSVRELLGPRDYSMDEATRILGQAIGRKDLKYVQFPYEDTVKALQGMGMSADVANRLVDMNRGFNEGRIRPTEARAPKNTTPTTLEDFSKVFAGLFGLS